MSSDYECWNMAPYKCSDWLIDCSDWLVQGWSCNVAHCRFSRKQGKRMNSSKPPLILIICFSFRRLRYQFISSFIFNYSILFFKLVGASQRRSYTHQSSLISKLFCGFFFKGTLGKNSSCQLILWVCWNLRNFFGVEKLHNCIDECGEI